MYVERGLQDGYTIPFFLAVSILRSEVKFVERAEIAGIVQATTTKAVLLFADGVERWIPRKFCKLLGELKQKASKFHRFLALPYPLMRVLLIFSQTGIGLPIENTVSRTISENPKALILRVCS